MNINCPISTPTLKNSNAIGIAFAGRPTSLSALAKSEAVQQAEHERDDPGFTIGETRTARARRCAISLARNTMLSAMLASTGGIGTWIQPSVAAASVRLCATVNAVIVQSRRAWRP